MLSKEMIDLKSGYYCFGETYSVNGLSTQSQAGTWVVLSEKCPDLLDLRVLIPKASPLGSVLQWPVALLPQAPLYFSKKGMPLPPEPNLTVVHCPGSGKNLTYTGKYNEQFAIMIKRVA